jgi:hypothetical protein
MGGMQERITTTKKGSITSVQAVYVPADDCMFLGLGVMYESAGKLNENRLQ